VLTYVAAHNNLEVLGKVSRQILDVGSTADVVHGMLYDGSGGAARYIIGNAGARGPGCAHRDREVVLR
jgi:hypothetical protein